MENKKIAIIGAGIAGLSVGCYLQMNGYDTKIFEMHESSGGLCTSWQRNNYNFNGCIRWISGTTPQNDMHKIWEELGALEGKKVVNHEIFVFTDLGNGRTFSAYADPDKLRNEMLRVAPEDKELIEEFIQAVYTLKESKSSVLKPYELQNYSEYMKDNLSDLPAKKVMDKWGKLTIADMQRKLKNPFLSENLPRLFNSYSNMPAAQLIYTLALFAKGDAGYPIGGSLDFIKSIEKKYLKLGGKIKFISKVERIIVEKNKVNGIHLNSGEDVEADIVISAADGYDTLYNMLEGKYIDNEIGNFYKRGKTFSSIIQVSFGVAREFNEIPNSVFINIPLREPLIIDPKNSSSSLQVTIYNFDSTLAPKGKTAISAILNADYEYWTNLIEENLMEYRREKRRIVDTIVEALDEKYGNVKDNLEIYDVATPDTYIRCTNNWKGSYEGWLVTTGNFGKRLKMVMSGLKNFYMIGQWIQPGGGVATGAIHGRHLAQMICFTDLKEFKVPEE